MLKSDPIFSSKTYLVKSGKERDTPKIAIKIITRLKKYRDEKDFHFMGEETAMSL